ncbi:hypothetical protein FFLO_02277 [Filobasidium floriforme]|uniref:Glycine cleavage system H protein n=1 Tax=Filobasidium floriforme TaxID=5210 RepID=A0A8K0JMX7_9TREE|nr:hypothetical protein FFLO_02277 [Filobasidium floriforme]
MVAALLRTAVTRTAFKAAPMSRSAPLAGMRFSAVRFASSKRYTKDHEYVILDDATNIGTVGITDYAQQALGDVVFVELPGVDTEVAAEDAIGAVESVKAASDIYAPVSGVITEINETLNERANLLNKDSEGAGWLCKIKLSAPQEFETLLSEQAYKAHCEGESS